MPQPPTANMAIVWPTDHDDDDVWDVIMDAAIQGPIDQHDHTAGKGLPIVSGALKINADVSWASGGLQFAITNLRAVDFAPQAASGMTSLAGAFFVDVADGELYFRNLTGTNIKFTAGAALNVAPFAGGIGGDYSAVGALLLYDDATKSYWLQQDGSPRPWARVRVGDVDIYQTAPSITQRVRLQSPAALAASYALTLPAALAATNRPLAVDATGAMTLGSAMELAANNSFTISGTAVYKHGVKFIVRPFTLFMPSEIQAGGTNHVVGQAGISLSNNSIIFFALPELPQHARYVTVDVYFNSAADRTACTCVLYQTSAADPAATAFTALGVGPSNIGTAITRLTVAGYSPSGSQTLWVNISNGVSTPKLQAIVVGFDVP